MSTRHQTRPIDPDLRERSPSGGWREVAYVMHTADAHPGDGASSDPEGDLLEDVLATIEESDDAMIHESSNDLEVSAWS